MTTGDLRSTELLNQEAAVVLPEFNNAIAVEIGTFLANAALARALPIAIEIRLGEWTIYKAALPGSAIKNDGWITRKARVVELTRHSSLYERVKAEEDGVDWYQKHGVSEETHAAHGGGLPLIDSEGAFHGVLVVSGLPQVADHEFAVETLKLYLARQPHDVA